METIERLTAENGSLAARLEDAGAQLADFEAMSEVETQLEEQHLQYEAQLRDEVARLEAAHAALAAQLAAAAERVSAGGAEVAATRAGAVASQTALDAAEREARRLRFLLAALQRGHQGGAATAAAAGGSSACARAMLVLDSAGLRAAEAASSSTSMPSRLVASQGCNRHAAVTLQEHGRTTAVATRAAVVRLVAPPAVGDSPLAALVSLIATLAGTSRVAAEVACLLDDAVGGATSAAIDGDASPVMRALQAGASWTDAAAAAAAVLPRTVRAGVTLRALASVAHRAARAVSALPTGDATAVTALPRWGAVCATLPPLTAALVATAAADPTATATASSRWDAAVRQAEHAVHSLSALLAPPAAPSAGIAAAVASASCELRLDGTASADATSLTQALLDGLVVSPGSEEVVHATSVLAGVDAAAVVKMATALAPAAGEGGSSLAPVLAALDTAVALGRAVEAAGDAWLAWLGGATARALLAVGADTADSSDLSAVAREAVAGVHSRAVLLATPTAAVATAVATVLAGLHEARSAVWAAAVGVAGSAGIAGDRELAAAARAGTASVACERARAAGVLGARLAIPVADGGSGGAAPMLRDLDATSALLLAVWELVARLPTDASSNAGGEGSEVDAFLAGSLALPSAEAGSSSAAGTELRLVVDALNVAWRSVLPPLTSAAGGVSRCVASLHLAVVSDDPHADDGERGAAWRDARAALLAAGAGADEGVGSGDTEAGAGTGAGAARTLARGADGTLPKTAWLAAAADLAAVLQAGWDTSTTVATLRQTAADATTKLAARERDVREAQAQVAAMEARMAAARAATPDVTPATTAAAATAATAPVTTTATATSAPPGATVAAAAAPAAAALPDGWWAAVGNALLATRHALAVRQAADTAAALARVVGLPPPPAALAAAAAVQHTGLALARRRVPSLAGSAAPYSQRVAAASLATAPDLSALRAALAAATAT